MAESFTANQQDQRTFGDQQARLLTDLNRPNLDQLAQNYLQDAMRFFARRPFFFNDTDNTTLGGWVASTIYPQGSTILFTNSGTQYVAVALTTGTSNASLAPIFPTTIFTVPSSPAVPPPAPGTPGTVVDNNITWATVSTFTTPSIFTQLSTVYMINQYLPPIDWVAPILVEVTWSGNLRMPMQKVSYPELRSYDVIRPTPPTTYPTMYAWFQQQLYFWPYPVAFYAITLSYRTAPPIPLVATVSNFWTTNAEALVRHYANYMMQKAVIHDEAAATSALELADKELVALTGERIAQDAAGITPQEW